MKKYQRIFLTIGATILILFYGNYFIKNQKEVRQDYFNKSEITLIDKITTQQTNNNRLLKEKNKKNELLIFNPLTEKKENTPAVEEKMFHLGKKIMDEEKEKRPTKIVLTVETEPVRDNIVRYSYYKQTYRWQPLTQRWKKSTQEKLTDDLINPLANRPLTLGDIFTNQKNLLKINRQLQEQFLEESSKPSQDVLAILNLPILKENEPNFSYYDDRVVFKLPENTLGKKELTLNYQDYGEFLNKDFVAEKYLKEPKPQATKTPTKKVIALTFDDGPNDTSTLKVLELLKKEKIPATFFLLGQQVEKFPEITSQILMEGHEIGNHSYSHLNLDTLDEAGIKKEVTLTQAAIYKATGHLPAFIRPPYGSVSYQSAVVMGLPIVNWNVDSLDWKSQDHKNIFAEIEANHQSEGIVLMHDIHEESLKALPKVIKTLQKEEYEFVTISELLEVTPEPLTIYYDGLEQRILENK